MNDQEKSALQNFLRELGGVRLERKDLEAEALIRQAAATQPDALYLLTQKALLQEQALQGMQQQVAALQQQVSELQQAREAARPASGFLDSASQWGKSGTALSAAAPGWRAGNAEVQQPAPAATMARPGMFGGGGSFLGSMAGMLAGAAAGSFLFNGIEHMMHRNDQQAGSQHLGDLQQGQGSLPADNALARDAGVNDVGNASHREIAQWEDPDAGQDNVWSDSSADGDDYIDSDDDFA